MKAFITVVMLSVFFICSVQAQNVFPTGSGTFAGVGTTAPATAFHVYSNTTALSNTNFITIENRGANASYTTSHVLGGLLFAGYRDIRAPANVAGIWAVRTSANGGLNSWGDLVFATTNNAQNITADNTLPAERMRIVYNGYVGIGTSTPSTNLNVDPQGAGAILVGNSNTGSGGYTSLRLGISAQTNGYALIQSTGAAGSSYGNLVLNPSGGNILIGKTAQQNTAYKFDVNGDVRANKIVVNTTGADFVFDSSYNLKSLSQVENYIKLNNHLPDIKSAAEMQKEGVDVGQNQTKLLQKIEELTLYLIEQNKKIEAQDTLIQRLSEEQQKLRAQNEALLLLIKK